ncbi:hypothetical protein GN277_26605 [Lachnospiraceae bacterium WCA-9-b2]|uniref:Uncharacterized protein n=1 Tax=Sporofaciens musculi TaxID=2681861 RepID=A0A7X3MCU0_9FIRM|nr:hypothetical protein [Sporofaciens musculi]MXP73970.1 hypothetical protein [Sporofaciens musculi]MXP74056.1 hypothetical protein [Sporofaciens musculi]MXP78781.1 hypothetical protein [Sporofaciens musculi]
MAVSATLDGTPKQCSERLTDGEELKNRYQFLRLIHSIVALFWRAIKGRSLRDG